MKKSELKNGMIVTTRNGFKYMVLKNSCYDINGRYSQYSNNDILINIGDYGYMKLYDYNEDLTFSGSDDWDIIKVSAEEYCSRLGARIEKANSHNLMLYVEKCND